MIKTREQDYAATIYTQVEEIKNAKFKDDYKNAAKNLPFLIRSAGLVQALYFAQSRSEDGSKKLIEHLAQTLGNPNLLEDARTKPLNEYIYLTEKCLLALKWYKRFVDIHIEDKDKRNEPKNEVKKDVHTT